MASRRIKLVSFAAVAVLAAGGYFVYSLFAAQGQGTLAQAPLNTQVQVTPAFIMAVDDSGSMTFEGLYAADEQAYWNNAAGCINGGNCGANGFFSDANVLRTGGRAGYYHMILNGIRLDQAGNVLNTNATDPRLGIPPLDLFGFARSPAYNKQWFNPSVKYDPWVNADGSSWPESTPTAARSDPRSNGAAGTRGPNPIVTYDFTRDVKSQGKTANYFAFRLQPGMRLPKDTEYLIRVDRHALGCGGLVAPNIWQTVNPAAGHLVTTSNNLLYNPGAGTHRGGGCDVHINHFPAVVFLPVGTAPPPGFDITKAVTVANAGGPGVSLVKYELRRENFTSNYDAVIQNFANWYTYYGNRNRAMIAAMSLSMLPVNNMRIGYFSINKRSGNNPGMTGSNLLMRDINAGQKPALYGDMFTLPADGGTPTRSATVYMGDQFRRRDDNAPIQRACQVNAGMLFTDGFTNEGGTWGNAYRNIGNTDSTLPRPLGGNANGNTIADIAYSFYANNLRPLDFPAGLVRTPEACSSLPLDLRLDCQKNLHMNFYGITLGATGEIYGVNAAATDDPYTTYPNWSVTGTQVLSPENVDDIWHATINTRGEFVNAQTPAEVTNAMRRVLSSVSAGATPSGSIALTGARIGLGSLTVTPRYEVANEGTDWFSELTAEKVAVDASGRIAEFTFQWEASDELESTTTLSRRVFYGINNTVQRFREGSVSIANLCNNPASYASISPCVVADINALGINAATATRYLLGDRAQEIRRGGLLRDRTTKLGDIVNSTPVVSSPLDDYGYRTLQGTAGSRYAEYLSDKRTDGTRFMVYVGANDGMLHAFDGGMTAEGVQDGRGGDEVFGYIPTTSVRHMGNLLFPYDPEDRNDQKFEHRYYVDGPIAVSDAWYGNDWNTVLVGTSGAGGRSVFALDVTNPDGFAASDRLWEISDLNTALDVIDTDIRRNIGHVLGEPVIVPVRTRSDTSPNTVRWKAIFGNGYNSASGKAVLFMVDIGTGAPNIEMIEAVETGAGVPSGSNGLGNIVAIDRWGGTNLDGRLSDGYVDTVYGADQKGALWKFDLREANPVDPNRPLFVTRTHTEGSPARNYRQPITGGLTATAGPNGGVQIYFGSGSFSFFGDPDDESIQSLYAVNDTVRGPTTATLERDDLRGYQVEDGGTADTREVGVTVTPVIIRGWYVDLPPGERFVGNPRIASGVVFMPTYAPNTEEASCSTEGFNWLFGLNARTGAAALSSVRYGSPTGNSPGEGTAAVALDTGGSAPVKEVGVLVLPRLQPPERGDGGGTDPDEPPPSPPEQGCWMLVAASGADEEMYLPYPCGRQSWRQIE